MNGVLWKKDAMGDKKMKYLVILLVLCSCAKTASETATETALNQVAIVEQQIKKECPTVKINDTMNALRGTIQTQLATCNAEKETLEQKNATLWVALIGLLIIIGIANWQRIKRIF